MSRLQGLAVAATVVLAIAAIAACSSSAATTHHRKRHHKHGALLSRSSPRWNGDLATGNLSPWGYVQSCPGGITVGRDPLGGPGYVSKFSVSDQSVSARCPILGSAGNPSASLLSPGLFKPGGNTYIGFSTLFPARFSAICTPWVRACWMQVMELYGRRFRGSPPVALGVVGDRLVLANHWRTIWTSSQNITKGTAWEDVVLHVVISTNPKIGYIELWNNGAQQTFINGSRRWFEATLDPGVNWDGVHADKLCLDEHRGPNPAMGRVVVYQRAARVGATYASVAPHFSASGAAR
jgi:hypothetical protein